MSDTVVTDIQKLLVEADERLTKLNDDILKGNLSRLSLAIERPINLSGQIDKHLEGDEHFQEMVKESQKYNKQFVEEGTSIDRRYAALGSLLKGILKECLTTADVYERKVQIERLYNWYRDRRRRLMEEKMRIMPPSPKSVVSDFQFPENLRPETADSESLSDARKRRKLAERREAPRPASVEVARVLSPEEEEERRKMAKKRFMAMSRRNLYNTKAEREGFEIDEKKSKEAASTVRSERNFLVAGQRTYESNFLHYRKPLDEPMANMHKFWLTKRAEKIKEELEEKEIEKAMTTWSYNRSRIEEEINRRQESYRFGSQTGTHIHVRKPVQRAARRSAPSTPTPQGKKEVEPMRSESADGEVEAGAGEEGTTANDTEMEPEHSRLFSTPRQIIRPGSSGLTPYSAEEFRSRMRNKRAEDEEKEKKRKMSKGYVSPHPKSVSQKSKLAERELDRSLADKLAAMKKPSIETKQKDALSQVDNMLLKGLIDEDVAPSETRKREMEEVERIKQNFAKYNIPVSMGTLERAIFTPEDRVFEACVSLLPTAAMTLYKEVKKKGKKGAKKKGKGKKKKKGKK